jgi:hypothetical protein
LIAILDLQHISYKNIDARGMITGFQLLQVTILYIILTARKYSIWKWQLKRA